MYLNKLNGIAKAWGFYGGDGLHRHKVGKMDKKSLDDKYLGVTHGVDRGRLQVVYTYGIGLADELSAIREAYILTPARAAELARCALRTWNYWCKTGTMPRERFVAWVRAVELDWLERCPQAPVTGSRWRVDEQGRVRRLSKPTTNTQAVDRVE